MTGSAISEKFEINLRYYELMPVNDFNSLTQVGTSEVLIAFTFLG